MSAGSGASSSAGERRDAMDVSHVNPGSKFIGNLRTNRCETSVRRDSLAQCVDMRLACGAFDRRAVLVHSWRMEFDERAAGFVQCDHHLSAARFVALQRRLS
jgi:hypothetical protein